MPQLGLLLIIVGFLGGSLVSTFDPTAVPWSAFVPLLLLGCVGVAIVRVSSRRKATHADVLAANVRDIDESIAELAAVSSELARHRYEADVYDLPKQIDELIPGPVLRFVEARESIAHVYGVQAYAEVMSEFATAERYINRVWSCSAEGYVDEAQTYLERAAVQFRAARDRLSALAGSGSRSPK